jgi:hypothetical protein
MFGEFPQNVSHLRGFVVIRSLGSNTLANDKVLEVDIRNKAKRRQRNFVRLDLIGSVVSYPRHKTTRMETHFVNDHPKCVNIAGLSEGSAI